jgi:hypothetical protein
MKAWLARHRIFRALLFAGGALAIIATPFAYKGYDYIQNDPKFCTSCHLMQDPYGRWSKSGHSKVNCHTCHPGDIVSDLHQVWVTVTGQVTEKVEKHAEVPSKICGGCHLSNDPRWKQVGETAGHKLHFTGLGIQCVTCHAPDIHSFRPTDEMCKGCHYDQTFGLTAMQKNHCTSCHQFLAPAEKGLRPDRDTCARCHSQGVNGTPVMFTGWHENVQCSDCHPVHDPKVAELDAPLREGAARPCRDCHQGQMDPGDPSPVSAGHDRCTACHVPHSPELPVQRCRDCHEAEAARLPENGPHVCTDCHSPHSADVNPGDRCADCHRDRATLERDTPVAAHRQCTNCHEPHAPAKPDAPACARCHTEQAALARLAEPLPHQQCANCHKVHQPEQPRRCEQCHQNRVAATAPEEHQKCQSCHRPHGSPLVGDDRCAQCHAQPAREAQTGPAEHARCKDCHAAHDPLPLPMESCGNCHAAEVKAIATQPDAHQDCTSCHPRHDRRPEPPPALCARCHEDKAKHGPVPAGHADCTGCHSPHQVQPTNACARCHSDVVANVAAARVADHRECANCHGDAHGAPRKDGAACNGCHAEQTGRGLHAVPAHQDCARCHAEHPPRMPPAPVCLDCHDTRTIPRHPPEARGVTTCFGCHNFRGKGESP